MLHAVPVLGFFTIAFLLGMRHGINLDHIAIVDAITRAIPCDKKLSSFVGLLFSIGHGVIVTLFCILISIFMRGFILPEWLNTAMALFSILLLLLFGSMSLLGNSKLISDHIFHQFRKIPIETTTSIIIIGGIFAVSFDTLSQVSLFTLNITHQSSLLFSIMLGLVFTLGMILTDGLNGYLLSFLLRKTQSFSFQLSRGISLCIGLLSTTIGVVEMVKLI